MAKGPARVNELDSAVSVAHANRLQNKMYRSQPFSLFGHVKLTGSPFVTENSHIFLEGLGDIWSAKYVVWTVEHIFGGNGEYTTEADVGSDTSLYGTDADRQAALTEQGIEGPTDSKDDPQGEYIPRDGTPTPTAIPTNPFADMGANVNSGGGG